MDGQTKRLPSNIKWPAILANLNEGRLVPFLGAGASMANNGEKGLPSTIELARHLAKKCSFPDEDCEDIFRVAQYYAYNFGETRLREQVKAKLRPKDVKPKPSEVHNILAKLPIRVVLTTNYDRLMEHAFHKADKEPWSEIYNRFGNQKQIDSDPTVLTPLVYKLHGSLDDFDSMVITEDNYIDFLIKLIEGNPKVPDIISTIFRTCSILFIGYGLKDWNIRLMLSYFRETGIRSFAVQRNQKVEVDRSAAQEWKSFVGYWDKKYIDIYNCDALTFSKELERRYKKGDTDG